MNCNNATNENKMDELPLKLIPRTQSWPSELSAGLFLKCPKMLRSETSAYISLHQHLLGQIMHYFVFIIFCLKSFFQSGNHAFFLILESVTSRLSALTYESNSKRERVGVGLLMDV